MPQSIVLECDLPEPPQKVWRALTERELLAAWLMPNDMQPVAGSHFHFCPQTKDSGPIDCEVLEAIPNQLLSWRQSERADPPSAEGTLDSVVTIELAAMPDGGTHLRVVHDDFHYRQQATLCQLAQAA
jgi:uncharacterized protein YndB with AHSA1/START domain